MSSNRDWMYSRFNEEGISDRYIKGVEEFIEFAKSKSEFMCGDQIKCPCVKCHNFRFEDIDAVRFHLYSKGFMGNYRIWVAQGEGIVSREPDLGASSDERSCMDETEQPYRDMIFDALGQEFMDTDNDGEEGQLEEEPNAKAQEFYNMLKDADTPLWEGCTKQTRMSFVSQMLSIKTDYNLSTSCYNRIMATVTSSLPEGNRAPKDYYGAKKMLKGLGLGYEKIDACVNNCMLFYKQDRDRDVCTICEHPRYKPVAGGDGSKKGAPYKVLRYLPITPRLQRLFMSRKTAEHMTWHATKRGEPVSHPTDSEAWQDFDRTHPEFSAEDGNVRIAFCTDGFTPFRQTARPYSCWPVMIAVYNLPPSMCMTRPFIFLSLIIPGPKSPGKHLDVFLRPLVDELKTLWTEGVITYDAFRKKNFVMHVAVMWTISDFPALGMLCCWSTHGRYFIYNHLFSFKEFDYFFSFAKLQKSDYCFFWQIVLSILYGADKIIHT